MPKVPYPGKPLYPGSLVQIPGIPEEEENLPTPPLAPAGEEQTGGETALKPPADTPAQPAAPAPESELDKSKRYLSEYERLSQQAAGAGPTEGDYAGAALRRAFAEQRAAAPAYLQQMSTTLFHKPDFSGQTAAAKASLEAPEYALTAKEQAQKRLQGLAEQARKRVLLPTEMAEQTAKTQEAQARVDRLKPASPEEIEAVKKQFGIDLPKGATKGTVQDILTKGSETQIKKPAMSEGRRSLYQGQLNSRAKALNEDPIVLPQDFTDEDAKNLIAMSSSASKEEFKQLRLDLAQQQYELSKQRFQNKEQEEKQRRSTAFGEARNEKSADILKNQATGVISASNEIDNIKDLYDQYEKAPASEKPKLLEKISSRTKGLLVNYKEAFKFGALQAHEQKFLEGLTGSSSIPDIFTTQLFRDIVNQPINTKLDTLKDMLTRGLEVAKEQHLLNYKKPEATSAPAAQPAAAPKRRKAISADELP